MSNCQDKLNKVCAFGDITSNSITLIVSGIDCSVVHFKVKKQAPLLKLKKAYVYHTGRDLESVRFLYDGRRIRDDDTPLKLDMFELDTIEVYERQIGGIF